MRMISFTHKTLSKNSSHYMIDVYTTGIILYNIESQYMYKGSEYPCFLVCFSFKSVYFLEKKVVELYVAIILQRCSSSGCRIISHIFLEYCFVLLVANDIGVVCKNLQVQINKTLRPISSSHRPLPPHTVFRTPKYLWEHFK